MNNPFELAVKAGLSKKTTGKEYLMKVEGMSEDEANAYLANLNSGE